MADLVHTAMLRTGGTVLDVKVRSSKEEAVEALRQAFFEKGREPAEAIATLWSEIAAGVSKEVQLVYSTMEIES